MFVPKITGNFQDRPTELIHYFTQDGDYIESVFILDLHEQQIVKSTNGNRQRILWQKTGEKRKRDEPFNINDIPYKNDDETFNEFYKEVKECFKKKGARVITKMIYPEYNFIVQYLVKPRKVDSKATNAQPSNALI